MIFIFGKQEVELKEFDLIFDDIDSTRQVKLVKLSNKFKNNIFLLNNNKIKGIKGKNFNCKVKKFLYQAKNFKGNFWL